MRPPAPGDRARRPQGSILGPPRPPRASPGAAFGPVALYGRFCCNLDYMVSASPEPQDRPIVIWDDEPLMEQLEAVLARLRDVDEMMAQWSEVASWLMA